MRAVDSFVSPVHHSEQQTLTVLQENEAEEVANKLDRLKRAEKDRAKKTKDLENQIRKIQHGIDNPPEVEDLELINNQIVPCHFPTVGMALTDHHLATVEYGKQPHEAPDGKTSRASESQYRCLGRPESQNRRCYGPVSDLHSCWVRLLMIYAIRLQRLDDERHCKLENLRTWD